ncbi:glycogen debranching protein GlgX [Roseomonas sp. NAR14]|uniref:Glycogen debranching protein GlgX n=1 Tax=Roseomonas acroporae TaxID=2937791 RepID=A0A9X2BWM7_9PROT|nr:glycogen debranching protein GlgX [Roseomonas acroporae]MCK8784050.1 glycogen debranching protein GlgX [Roseomonas acroporae]
MTVPDRLLPGRPYPLGATFDGLGVNFAVFSAHAHSVELCLFDPSGRHETRRLSLPECTDEVWHGYLPEARPGLVYGYRAHGPYEPQHGDRFNPHKLLLDPYARRLLGEIHWTDALYGFRSAGARADLSFDRRDSAPAMPKAVVVDESFDWGEDRPPAIPWADTVIYEAHLRGLTMRHPAVPAPERGTFAGLAHPAVIAHLKRLGVTAVELLPVQAFAQDRFLVRQGLRNYWGYQPLAYFAPEPRYLAGGGSDEIRIAVRRLHAAGIEVILDVVYNHTCEGDETGPTLSWRGLDNRSYYRLRPDDPRRYVNDTGTGNTINATHPRVLQMVMDSLRHWVERYHVDGFRFDLGTVLGREAGGGFDPGAGFFDAVRQDPVLNRVKLISEPWDIGPGGWQVGNHPPGWAEWNDGFRDGVRRFWRGDAGRRPDIASRLAGSAAQFDRRCRRPWASINFVAAHDGFTLHDLVTYVEKHNEANGEGNRDGHGDNHGGNWGVEGETADSAVNAVRGRLKRAMLATLFLSAGTPMLLAGDEMDRTQGGNNNAYCQDNETSWVDWERAATPAARQLTAFAARCAALRRRLPPLRPTRFQHGATLAPGIPEIAWFDLEGRPMMPEAWGEPEVRTLALWRAAPAPEPAPSPADSEAPGRGWAAGAAPFGRAAPRREDRREDRREGGREGRRAGALVATLLLLNADGVPRRFLLPDPPLNWDLVLDSADPEAVERPLGVRAVAVAPRSAVLLAAKVDPAWVVSFSP